MNFRSHLFIFVLLAGILSVSGETESIKTSGFAQLEQRLEGIDTELGELAKTSLRTGVDDIDYRSRRHSLIEQELPQRYESLRNKLQWLSWLVALILIGALAFIWMQRKARERAITTTRERIAANLHDELGANLHAIGLLSDFAQKIVARKDTTGEWTELSEVVDEIRTLTEETGEKARYCTNMLGTKDIHVHLVEEMKRLTKLMLSDLEHDAKFPDEDSLHQLKPRRRIDLYLFYKECLTNIIRHSSATRVSVKLSVKDKNIKLTVSDNGQGLTESLIPKSLRRRAKILGGRVDAEVIDTGGTQISLHLNIRR